MVDDFKFHRFSSVKNLWIILFTATSFLRVKTNSEHLVRSKDDAKKVITSQTSTEPSLSNWHHTKHTDISESQPFRYLTCYNDADSDTKHQQ